MNREQECANVASGPGSRLWLRIFGEVMAIGMGVLAVFGVEDRASDRTDRRVEMQYLTSVAADVRFDSALVAGRLLPGMQALTRLGGQGLDARAVRLGRDAAGRRFRGILGMEHGNSMSGEEGEEAVIAAYREVDVSEG